MANKQRVVVGLSGGVDSAVSAHLLKEQGYEVIGIFMKNWEDDDNSEYCSSNIDFVDAASVADVLGIEIEHVNFAADYKDRVFAEFLREYSAGRTPNPDILCNAEIKFKAFLDHAMRLGAEKIATGHYARVRFNEASGKHELLKGLDDTKDQSYFLHRLNQAQLSKTLFPVGELRKTEVRRLAAEIGLPNAKKKDSTGICFIGERPFREFLNRYLPRKPGPMVTPEGKRVGEHIGLAFYTIGQRKGIGLGGTKDGAGEPWYVAEKRMATNELVVVRGHDHPLLMRRSLEGLDASWVLDKPAAGTAHSTTASPSVGCGTPTAAVTCRPGNWSARFSISSGETLAPPVLIRLESRPVQCRKPWASIVPPSWLRKKPSASKTCSGSTLW